MKLPWALVETERRLLPQIQRMEDVGLPVDLDYFAAFSGYLAYQLEVERAAITERGGPVNPNSADQIAGWLYDDLAVTPPRKRLKSGRATTEEKYLQAIAHRSTTTRPQRHAVEQVLSYKELVTLKTRYVDPMPTWARDGRLHAQILYTRTDTGRLAAKNPNVLAFPKHSDLGLLVRRGFVAPPGRVLAEWDLQQIEIVMLAIDSGDARMLGEIRAGIDKHRATAADILYRIPLDQVTPEQRFAAKAVNFGIVMGLTAKGLREQFDKQGSQYVDHRTGRHRAWTDADCQQLLDAWAQGYPQAAAYLGRKHAEARRLGYVTDWRGRRRWLPAVHSPHRQVAAEALRQAQATPIQAGAQELTKLWMLAVWPRLQWLRASGIYVELLLQVHDALLCELDAGAYDEVDAHVHAALGELPDLGAPISCKGSGPARTWADC